MTAAREALCHPVIRHVLPASLIVGAAAAVPCTLVTLAVLGPVRAWRRRRGAGS